MITRQSDALLQLLQVFQASNKIFGRLAWSPDGQSLAAPSYDARVYVWHLGNRTLNVLSDHAGPVYDLSWSPDGRSLATASADKTIKLWDVERQRLMWTFEGHHDPVYTVDFSPDGKLIASGGRDRSLRIWNVQNGQEAWRDQGFSEIKHVAWAPKRDQRRLAVASGADIKIWDIRESEGALESNLRTSSALFVHWLHDGQTLLSTAETPVILLWNTHTGRLINRIEGHLDRVNCVTVSADGRLMASKSADGTVKLWRFSDFSHVDLVYSMVEPTSAGFFTPGIAFHPTEPMLLATLGEKDRIIRLWRVKLGEQDLSALDAHNYVNAKVAFVGESGVGKSNLAEVISGRDYRPGSSTHGRRVWTMSQTKVAVSQGKFETREIIIWDLAGQPGYRLTHQLHLTDVEVAVIVIDASRDPKEVFASVRAWSHALDAVLHRGRKIQKLLVIARIDRGNPAVSDDELYALAAEVGITPERVLRTSAKNGFGIQDLRQAIENAIDWNNQYRVNSTGLFNSIRAFLVRVRPDSVLIHVGALFESFYRSPFAAHYRELPPDELKRAFITSIVLLQGQGIVRRFDFGKLVLLQPEVLDNYAAGIANAAMNTAGGVGAIREDAVLAGRFMMGRDERLVDTEEERLLLIATVQDLVAQEIALREQTPHGWHLIFPTQYTRETDNLLLDPGSQEIVFTFEGNAVNIYATLVVRLAHTGLFQPPEMWRNAAIFSTKNARYAVKLEQELDGTNRLRLLYERSALPEIRGVFEDFVERHLLEKATLGTVARKPVFACPQCGEKLTDSQVERRLKEKKNYAICPVCENKIHLVALSMLIKPQTDALEMMGKQADLNRERHEAIMIDAGRRLVCEYDVCLLYDDPGESRNVLPIAEELRFNRILAWFNEWDVEPGESWQSDLKRKAARMSAMVLFAGVYSQPWRDRDMQAFIHEFASQERRIVIARLPGCPDTTVSLPGPLAHAPIVDFNNQLIRPYQRLVQLIRTAKH